MHDDDKKQTICDVLIRGEAHAQQRRIKRSYYQRSDDNRQRTRPTATIRDSCDKKCVFVVAQNNETDRIRIKQLVVDEKDDTRRGGG